MRKLGSAYTIAVGLMLLAAPAYAQDDYPPDSDAGLTVSESTVSPGESFTVSGDGAAPGATVTIKLAESSSSIGAGTSAVAVSPALARSLAQVRPVAQGTVTLGSTTAESDGSFSVTVTIPSWLDAGTYTLTATSGGEVLGVATIRVVVAAAAGALPFTGGNVAPGLGVGIALILAGGLLLVAIRRRRTATA
jgi:hypothetical protein